MSLLSSADIDNYLTCGVLRKFSQIEFSEALIFTSENIDYYGWVWIPTACLSKQCKVHMHFHGTGGGTSDFSKSGFRNIIGKGGLQYGCHLEMIVLFPMSKVGLFNAVNRWNVDGHL